MACWHACWQSDSSGYSFACCGMGSTDIWTEDPCRTLAAGAGTDCSGTCSYGHSPHRRGIVYVYPPLFLILKLWNSEHLNQATLIGASKNTFPIIMVIYECVKVKLLYFLQIVWWWSFEPFISITYVIQNNGIRWGGSQAENSITFCRCFKNVTEIGFSQPL